MSILSDGRDILSSSIELLYDSDDEVPPSECQITSIDKLSKMFIGDIPYEIPETISRELKEFWICPNSEMLPKESVIKKMFLENDFYPLRSLINHSLENMMNKYVAKNLSAFFNTNIQCGELNFGWNDDGEVTGVIVESHITRVHILDMIRRQGKHCISMTWLEKGYSNQGFDILYYRKNILESIQVDIKELSTSPENVFLDDWSEKYLVQQQKRVDNYRLTRNKYLAEKRLFLNQLQCFRRSVTEMINDPRIHPGFIDYIKKIKLEGVPLDDPVRNLIISQVKDIENNPLYFEDGQICREKNTPEKISFWITRYRDYYCRQLLKKKPIMPFAIRPCKPYKSLLQRNPIARIIKGIHSDSRFKIIIIRIILPGRLAFPPQGKQMYHPSLCYQNPSGEVRSPTRTLTSNGPSCM